MTEKGFGLKTLDELKMIVMEELCANPVVHNIQITYQDDDVHANDDDHDDNYVDETTAINSEDFVNKDEYEERIERGDFGDFERDIDKDETLDDSVPDVDNVISVQNIMNIISAYAPPVYFFD
ncbi:hypothetical protein SO802_017434 [Lithocarpus litseifolius]|uniref:Uncharacterized protein n=1 Tax=Lithocarpus litseifolius TaxID=425828 RepID=A0AAW2CHY4_9ROSI